MSIENVRTYLKHFKAEKRIQEFSTSSATVEQAAQALNCEPCRIAKTLSFDLSGETLLIVTAGDCKIDNAKYKQTFQTKAKMLTATEVLPRTGHAIGGVCPFANPQNVKIYLDVSLKRFQTVFPACGSTNSAIELNLAELEKYTKNQGWVDVCKQIS